MNLHSIVSGSIAAINPFESLVVYVSTGYLTADDGSRTPTYAPAVTVPGQVQALTFRDLQQIDGLNLQGLRRGMYLNGRIDGIVRETSQGGDIVIRPEGTLWLVAIVLEQWPDWVKVAVTQQVTPVGFNPSLDYSDPRNSMYLPGGL